MVRLKTLAIAFLLLVSQLINADEPASSNMRIVEDFISAFNAHDSSALADFVAEDVDWLSIDGDKVAIESRGKSALITSMDAYFRTCPSCQSTLLETISTPGRVSAVEVASWEGKSGPGSQRAISVYEFSGNLIQRVYYFPAEK